MKTVTGLRMLALKLSLLLALIFISFGVNAKTLKVDTVTASVADGDFTITPNGTGDIVLGSGSGFVKLTSGVLSNQEFINLTSEISGILPIANGGTGSSSRNYVDLVSAETIAGVKTFSSDILMSGTGQIAVASGTTAQRSGTPVNGMIRHNSDLNQFEGYNDDEWGTIGGAGGAGGSGINFVEDASFEASELAPDFLTGGTVTYPSYIVNENLYSPFNEKYYKNVFSSLSSADLYVRDSFARTDLDGKAGLMTVWVKATGIADLELCLRVDDASYATACSSGYLVKIKTDNTWTRYEIPFVFGAASVQYEIFNESATGSSVEINLDNIYVGVLPEGYISNVSGTRFIGSMAFLKSSPIDTDCRVNSASTSFVLANLTGCNTAGVFKNLIPDESTLRPSFKLNVVSGNTYNFLVNDFIYQYNADAICETAISVDGGTTNHILRRKSRNDTAYYDQSQSGSSYEFTATTTGEVVVKYLTRNSVASQCEFMNRLGDVKISVYEYPDLPQAILKQNTEFQALEGAGNDGSAVTSSTDIKFTEVRDNLSSWDGDSFTAKNTGYYIVNGSANFTANLVVSVYGYIDGVQDKRIGFNGNTSISLHPFKDIVYLEKGQVYSVRSSVSATLSNSIGGHYIHIQYFPTAVDAILKLNQTSIAKDEDKYTETEKKWGFWNGEQLYRRCFTVGSNLTSTTTITSWVAGLKPKNVSSFSSAVWGLVPSITEGGTSGNISYITYNSSTGDVVASISGHTVLSGTSACMEYVK